MKYMVLVGVLAMVAVTVLPAQSPPAKDDAASSNATSSSEAWAKLKSDLTAFQNGNPPDEDSARKQITSLLGESHDFAAKFPSDPKAWNATMLWAQLGEAMNRNHWAGSPSAAEIDQAYDQVLADKNTPVSARGEIRAMRLLGAMADAAGETGDASAKWTAVENGIADFEKEFGADFSLDGETPAIALLRQKEIMLLSFGDDTPASEEILKKLGNDPQPEVADLAKRGLDRIKMVAQLKRKPIELKFTAVDGRQVDVAKLRGKVVLIDFWATWCGPCVEEMPDVIATYKKYHDKGLEIVGISLDADKDSLLGFIKRKGMPWPQYFDGLRFDNKISSGFDIDAIPAMWLLDKKGMLVSTDAADGLSSQVERLLKAP